MAGVSGTTGVSGQTTKWISTTNAYEWWDGALQGTISYKTDLNGAPGTTYVTTFAYNEITVIGALTPKLTKLLAGQP